MTDIDPRVAKAVTTAYFHRKEPQRVQGLIDDFTKLPPRYYVSDNAAVEQTGAAKAEAFRMSFVRSSSLAAVNVCRDGGTDSLSSFMEAAHSPCTSPMPSPRTLVSPGDYTDTTHTSKHGLVNYSVHESQAKKSSSTSTSSLFAKLKSLSIRRDQDLPDLVDHSADDGFETERVSRALQRLPSYASSHPSPLGSMAPALSHPWGDVGAATKQMLGRTPSKRCLKTSSDALPNSHSAPPSPDSSLAFETSSTAPAPAAAGTLPHTSSKRCLSFARTTSLGTSLQDSLDALTKLDDAAAGGPCNESPSPRLVPSSFRSFSRSKSAALDYDPGAAAANQEAAFRSSSSMQRADSVRTLRPSLSHRASQVDPQVDSTGVEVARLDEYLDGMFRRDSGSGDDKTLPCLHSKKHVTLGLSPRGGGSCLEGLSPRGGGSCLESPREGQQPHRQELIHQHHQGAGSFVEEAKLLLLRCPSLKGASSQPTARDTSEQQEASSSACLSSHHGNGHHAPLRNTSVNGLGANKAAALQGSSSLPFPTSTYIHSEVFVSPRAARGMSGDADAPRSPRDMGPVDQSLGSLSGARGVLTRMASARHIVAAHDAPFSSPRGRSTTETAAPGEGCTPALPRSLSVMRKVSLSPSSFPSSPSLSPQPPSSPREHRSRPQH